ncbi:signal peptidase I [Flavivirga jejuensis]|uniref:Signal peptidase I n=2 Tax=Flavivirga jejuensis TaxID=870487 RepID=A0ABT8WS40_9FLAO|nr:signal peptidase I [Flavivirga jejuensis]MDO5975929.1 signal peptidase I [Flavivirga jejuensis]
MLLLFGLFHLIRFIKHPVFYKYTKNIYFLFLIFSASVSIKILLFDIYKIPSSSMNNTLYYGDVIIVNKLKYGPKLPRSPFEIPWVNIAFYLNDKTRASMNSNWWKYKRLSGTTIIKNGDIMVFDINKNTYVKRCMAIAGDTIIIKQGDVYINNKLLYPSNLILNKYEFKVNDRKTFNNKLDSLGLNIEYNRTKQDHFIATLSIQDKNKLVGLNLIKGIKIVTPPLNAYPKSKHNKWSWDEYGPYIIPKKEMRINLNPKNYLLYKKLIYAYEGVKIKNIRGVYLINGEKENHYIFKKNYYFMLGDNRKNSKDSRYLGPVPEEQIVGKVQCVLFSNYQDKFRWDRLFKTVN